MARMVVKATVTAVIEANKAITAEWVEGVIAVSVPPSVRFWLEGGGECVRLSSVVEIEAEDGGHGN